ncbi:sporulation integral membrane protein YtvI [Clostridium sp.]|uniref:sporulation integral membrane protein YtvI n=1 Tax=Clostridium sp. TaxID=1506 RepID=UPI0026179BBC|nr:sporulation integral membrane protein YtvI [Clostridium sp.]
MRNNTSLRRRKLEDKEEYKHKKVENRKAFIINLIFYITVLLLIYFVIKYALVWFLPFVIGFGIAFVLKPLIRRVSNKYSLNSKLVAGVLVTLFYLTVGALLTVAVIKISVSLKDLFMGLPSLYSNKMEPAIYEIIDKIEKSVDNLDPTLVEGITDIAKSFGNSIANVITTISASFAKGVSSVPSIFIIIMFSIISSYFIAMDYNLITAFIMKQFPKKVSSTILNVKDQVVGTLFKLIKSYTILISMTFVELSIGFIILKINNPLQLAFLIAIVDILPILGTGGILIPWAIVLLIRGNLYVGIGIAIIYIVITIIRNIVEPRLVGKQIGLHPLIMLICMYIGIKLFGFLGIFILPLILIILINLNNIGKINIVK